MVNAAFKAALSLAISGARNVAPEALGDQLLQGVSAPQCSRTTEKAT